MLNRGKFKSLIMINWNGFFARQYDLDDLVTTLSGGNGAGKSTTMAAFITALIPDLSLLHFRNTTEAGSTSSSRDRGLHGKLKSGVCYAALECENSRGERYIFGVRLQQVAGRDKKVDLKLFSISGLTQENAIKLFFEEVGEKAKILNINDLKVKYDDKEGLLFKSYNSLGDYHAQMFDFGFLPKRLRTPQDRSRFYRLIEASLYGGISSTITKSLREYLLPENQSVKRAFQDMENAILENRMTLNKIEQTKTDRNFFKDLVGAAIDYVGADYIYQQNNRKTIVAKALEMRQSYLSKLASKESLEQEILDFSEKESKLKATTESITQKLARAQEYLTLLTNASRVQKSYNDKLAELQIIEEDLAINEEIVEDLAFEKEELSSNKNRYEDEISSLRTQLADQQQALDQQQTRQVQYKQALSKLNELNQALASPEVHKILGADFTKALPESQDTKNLEHLLAQIKNILDSVNKNFSSLNNALQAGAGNKVAYDKAYKALQALTNNNAKGDLYRHAQNILKGALLKQEAANRVEQLSREFASLTKKKEYLENNSSIQEELEAELGRSFSSKEEVAQALEERQHSYFNLDQQKEQIREELHQLNQELNRYNQELGELNRLRIPYFQAQQELQALCTKLETNLPNEQAVRDALKHYLTLANKEEYQLKNLEQRRDHLKEEIYRVEKSDVGLNQDLDYLAQDLGGVLLSEIYEDIALDDAPYYAAVYGPASNAIVVPSLTNIEEKLKNIQDLPQDLYLIQNDINNFDEDIFVKTMVDDDNVLVSLNSNLARLSRINPDNASFGKASRERFLEKSKEELKNILYDYSVIEKDYYTHQNLVESLTNFVSQYLNIAFLPNPENRLRELSEASIAIERQIQQGRTQLDTILVSINEAQQQSTLLNKLQHVFIEDSKASVEEDYYRIKSELAQGQEAQRYLATNAKSLADLEEHASALQFNLSAEDDLEAKLEQVKREQALLSNLQYLGTELLTRSPHLQYKNLGELLGDELSENIRLSLKDKEAELSEIRKELNDIERRYEEARNKHYQQQARLNATRDALNELEASLKDTGTSITPESLVKAAEKVNELADEEDKVKEKLFTARSQHQNNQRELELLEGQIRTSLREYSLQRKALADNKVKWQESQRLAKENALENRLLKVDLIDQPADKLRSISDRALGLLRTLIADNEYLRDSLKESEDNRQPHKKVAFFISIYDHLRERIRQDVLTTNDPIEAIEQMEVQLDRLTNQLQQREKSLVISAGDVASILDKTIQREQNRIWQLNQGLQNMSFGQVKSVRLSATYRESHAALLNALRENREEHADLFESNELSFTEALAKLYQRTNADFEIGQRNYSTVGEELLDYRNYINLGIEVFRGSDGWLKAESGALSTGEAIGTGMSILLMVVQSWEEESKRIRQKDLLPCRLLFLDEAARLDAKSIATLFELCERQKMQLLIAAPENISPDNGTTYKLMRRIEGKKEYVYVVGLRGFGNKESSQPNT